ncbi:MULTISPECIES: hypothetical protein [unclassified Bartonella]|uniref:hypothetical protein n=1 Tax=unclassified Bartonella TaxID=2645622 RepID=UPI0035CF7E3E
MRNCGRLCGGKLPAGSLGDKAMVGQRVIQWGWSDTESILENKNEGLGGRKAAVQTGSNL